MRISLLTVLYNSSLMDVACLAPAKASGLVDEIVVCDNSIRENNNAVIASSVGAIYVPMGGNVGLSRAYNAGIERCTGDVVCVFDDDTKVERDYFEAVRNLWNSDCVWDVALPLVMARDSVLSPSDFDGYRSRPYADALEVRGDAYMGGINSGMAVKRETYRRIRYDERLFLELIDFRFLQDVRNAGLRVVYLQGPVLYQDYSQQTDDAERSLSRLRIWEEDSRVFYGSTAAKRLYRFAALLKRKATLSLRFKTLRFFKSANKEGNTTR